jgi:hypothetical protein
LSFLRTSSLIVADLGGEFEIGAEESGPRFGNEFLVGIARRDLKASIGGIWR